MAWIQLTRLRRVQKVGRGWSRSEADWGRFVISKDGDKKAVCSSFRVSNYWPLTVTIPSLMTSSWPGVCCGEDEPCQQTFSPVSGFCFSSSLFSFMAVIPEKQDGENERPAGHIHPRSFISSITALRASYNPSTNRFPSRQIPYLLQRAEFSEIPLLLAAALKRLDNVWTLRALLHKRERELLAGLSWPLASLEGRVNKQSWVTLWRPW